MTPAPRLKQIGPVVDHRLPLLGLQTDARPLQALRLRQGVHYAPWRHRVTQQHATTQTTHRIADSVFGAGGRGSAPALRRQRRFVGAAPLGTP